MWLPIEVVIEHNRLEVEETGERHLLRDRGLLESALARSCNFYAFGKEDVLALAVVVLAGIARAHAFEQGNKRPPLQRCGYDTAFDDSISWADQVINLIEHRITEKQFAAALRPHVVPRP